MAVRRLGLVVAALVASCSAPALQTAGGSMTGTWQGAYQGVQIQLVVQPSGTYSETQTVGSAMTMVSGQIEPAGPGEVTFTVQDWQPRTQNVYHPTGTVGGYYSQDPVAPPPGGTYKLQFAGANAFTLQDVTYGGVITYTRAA